MIKIALAGNPNSGKTTLFNSLTGSSQYVGNWPGVTVEKKEGKLKGHRDVTITDLPGIYSLSPYTPEEVIARNYLIGEAPDAVINIIDGTNLERNLYLTTQLLEIGVPVIMAVNMMDVVRRGKDMIAINKLSEAFGCPVVGISALKGEGIPQLAQKAVALAESGEAREPVKWFSKNVETALLGISELLPEEIAEKHRRWYSIKLFERDKNAIGSLKPMPEAEAIIKAAEKDADDDSESIITSQRYEFVSGAIKGNYTKGSKAALTLSDKIDRIVTNRFLALPIFALVMIAVYYVAVTTVGDIVTAFTNDMLFGEWIQGGLAGWLEGMGVAAWLVSLIADGIVGGVGAVIGFVPQMLILFLMLAVLEECGYMSRIAFIMDRLFRKFGLSGKSFIPFLIGTGCGIPGIMASRTIENENDRRMTIICTTFMPCGAKLPIIALIAGAIFGGAWWVSPAAYFIGVAAIIVSGIILKKTRPFSGEPAPFVMELPAYHLPTVAAVLRSMWERGWSFIKKAGTVILASSVVIWFLSSFGFSGGTFAMVEDINSSILASVGGFIAPIFAPLGFGNWESATATVMGLVAKEEVVGVFGVLYGVAGDALELVESGAFGELGAIAAHFTGLSAFSFLLFNLLCAPCFAAIGAISREMNSGKWTAFAVAYQCVFAYIVAFIVYQLGLWISGSGFGAGALIAFVLAGIMLYMLFRPARSAAVKIKSAEVSL